MNTTAVFRKLFRCSVLLAGALICFGSSSCFRGYDLSKLKCSTEESCPKGYSCVWLPEQTHGTCIAGSVDGGRTDDQVSSGSDGKTGVDGVLPNDGSRDMVMGGSSGERSDAHFNDANGAGGGMSSGGASGSIDAPASGGSTAGGGQTRSGATSTETTIATGGTIASPDAPVENPDALVLPPDASLVKGAPCISHGQCASTLCIDGVCCEKPCSGCNACANAMTGETDGTCAPVPAGNDPHKTCEDETATTLAKPCGDDGTCDGRGSCRKVAAGKECGPASCSSNGTTFTPASKCDGKGACVAGSSQTCTPYDCAITGCKKTCATQDQCDTGTYCDVAAGTCVSKKGPGDACTPATADRCSTGTCVDGHCCSQPSCGICQACAGTGGTCVAIENAEDADTCSGTSSCNAAGSCKKKNAQPCSLGSECLSSWCADGVCCNSECQGACETCNGATPGTCGYVTGSAKHGTCSGTGVCQATCQGSSANCTPASTAKVCRQPNCDSATNTQTLEATCSTAGTCPTLSTSGCSPYKCGSTTCQTGCTNNDSCVNGAACLGGVCTICPSGQTACPNHCVDLKTSNEYCGSCTKSCTGGKTCQGGTCSCPTNTSDCGLGGTCFNTDSDRDHCGSTCKQCATVQQCSGGTCMCPLGGALSACGDCLSWDFESGTGLSDTNGWVRNPNTWTSAVFSLSRVVSPTYNSSGHSLAITVNNSGGFAIMVPVCPTTDLSNLSFSAQVRIHDLGGASSVDVANLAFSAPENALAPAGWLTTRTVGTDSWIPITGGGYWPNGTTRVGLYFSLNTDSWSGTVYLDNVLFSP